MLVVMLEWLAKKRSLRCGWGRGARLINLDGTEGQVVEQGMWAENSSVVLGEGDVAFFTPPDAGLGD